MREREGGERRRQKRKGHQAMTDDHEMTPRIKSVKKYRDDDCVDHSSSYYAAVEKETSHQGNAKKIFLTTAASWSIIENVRGRRSVSK
jgi:hypothetical protein